MGGFAYFHGRSRFCVWWLYKGVCTYLVESVKKRCVKEMVGVVDVRYKTAVEQMTAVLHRFLFVLREATADQPADEARAAEYVAVCTHTPSEG